MTTVDVCRKEQAVMRELPLGEEDSMDATMAM